MARKNRKPRRDWRMVVFLILSLILVLSMALGSVLAALSN